MVTTLRWVAFGIGVAVTAGTVLAVMKTLIVPRRSWSFIPALVGRMGYRFFHGIGIRLARFDLADRFLGFQAPVVVIGILVSLMGSFVVGFALMLMPWSDLTVADALREAGSSVFTLGFISSTEPVATILDVLAGATGMIFVALTIGYLPTIYSEVKARERQVRQLSGWAGTPSWGPEVLSRFALAGALDLLPSLFTDWDAWCGRVADTHVKYPVLAHFRLPRSGNHFVVALLAVMDAAAMEVTLRSDNGHGRARLFLNQGLECLKEVSYPMRRVEHSDAGPGITRNEFEVAVERLREAEYPMDVDVDEDEAWSTFAEIRSAYAPLATELAFWLVAVPAPWSGARDGFESDPVRWPERKVDWSI